MSGIVVYSSGYCPYCFWARSLLTGKQLDFDEIRIDEVPGAHEEMLARSNGQTTVPQIFIGEYHIGGFDDLKAMDVAGRLDTLLAEAGIT